MFSAFERKAPYTIRTLAIILTDLKGGACHVQLEAD